MKTDLQERVERLLAKSLPSPSKAIMQAADPAVIFQMWCSATGKPFHVLAEKRGSTLFLKRNIVPQNGTTTPDNGNSQATSKLGQFDFDDGGWPGCPHCGARKNDRKGLRLLWACGGGSCGGHFHCAGERGGMFRCACGQIGDFDFHSVASFEVHGTAGACESQKRLGTKGGKSLPPPSPRLSFNRK